MPERLALKMTAHVSNTKRILKNQRTVNLNLITLVCAIVSPSPLVSFIRRYYMDSHVIIQKLKF